MMSNYSTLPRLRRRLNTTPPVQNREPQQLATQQESSPTISSLRRLAYSTSMKLRRTASTSSDVATTGSLRQRLQQRRKSSYQLPVSVVLSDEKQHWLTNQDEDDYFDSDFVSLIYRKKESTSLELLVQHGLGHLTRTDLKRMEKVSRINIHLHALFAAVEFGQVEKARAILDNNEVDINSYNSDGLSLLDVALLTSNVDMVKLLAKHGATEGLQFGRSNKEALSLHLVQLLNEAEKQLDDTSTPATSATASSNSPLRIDQDKHLALWKRRVRILRKMKSGLEQLKLPSSPNQARVEVVGERSAHVWWLQPEIDTTTASVGIATKFKVQWSTQPDFNPLGQGGEVEVRDAAGRRSGSSGSNGDELNEVRVTVSDCPVNAKCYFRVAAGNLSGFGQFKATLPSSVHLSAWRAIDGRKPRFAGRLPALDDLFGKVRTWRPDYASEIRQVDEDAGGGGSGGGSTSVDWQNKQRKNAAKINLRQFFGATVKFQKNLRRGVYFACTLFHEDKVLVTSEEFPPVVEVDDTYPASVNNDFHWLMKIGCTWSDVKALRQDMERSLSSSSAHFRIKLLQAAAQLQTALGLQDLGQLHYQPLKDSQGTMVISSTCHLANIKAVPPSLNFKWLPLSKLQQRRRQQQESETSSSSSSSPSASDLLIASLDEQISFQQVSSKPLRRGLYLGYLKMKSSVDLIRVLVPKDAPNLLPHWKIRDNPWVSSEEWQWIKKLAKSQVSPAAGEADDSGRMDDNKPPQPTTGQLLFQSQLQRAAHKLLASMGISDTALQHRIYEDEVIELSPEVSVILLLPPADSVCAVAGQSDALFHRPEFLSVPVQVFEMIHLRTYQRELIGRYSRLSSILELDSNLAQLALREAFSSVELAEAKQRIVRLQELQVQVDSTWRGSRWIMDVLSLARDRSVGTGVGVAISALSSHHSPPPPIPMLPTPTETVPSTAALQEAFSINTSSSRRLQANEGITRQGSGGRQRLLVKTKSDNKLLVSNNNNNNNNRMMTAAESPAALLRVLGSNNDSPTARSRTPVCTECSVPLDLPGYVTNCSACSFSRNPRTQALSHQRIVGAEELLFARQQHSRSNEALQQPTALSHPPLSLQHSSSTGEVHQHQPQRRVISRSENQLNSLGFLPFLDAEDCDNTTPAYATVTGEETEQQQQQQQQEETLAPPSKLQRGGSSSGAVKKVKSSSSAASSSGRRPSSLVGGRSDSRGEDSEPTSLLLLRSGETSHQSTPSLTSLSSTEGESAGSSTRSSVAAATLDGAAAEMEPEATGIIQVYAAYESGLANGTSVKLHVTTRTVAREVVDLVVRQLNMAVVLKGKEGPVYSADEFKNFCLVAVIGARERCLRDDFKPLHLQNPWKKGRLFVRQKKDVLAAIEQSGRQHQHHQHSSQPAAL